MLLSHALVKQQRILQQLDVLSKMASFFGGGGRFEYHTTA